MSVLAEAAPDESGGLTGWAVGLMETMGGVGAALIVGLDNLFPPIPSELVLPLAGFSASRGVFQPARGAVLDHARLGGRGNHRLLGRRTART